jgi:hypothetical protein
MNVNVVNSNKLIGLQEFLSDALGVIGDSGSSPLLVLHDNKPAFYAIPVSSWNAICDQLKHDQAGGESVTALWDGLKPSDVMQSMSVQTARHKGLEVDQPTFEKKEQFQRIGRKALGPRVGACRSRGTEWRIGGYPKEQAECPCVAFFQIRCTNTSHARRLGGLCFTLDPTPFELDHCFSIPGVGSKVVEVGRAAGLVERSS